MTGRFGGQYLTKIVLFVTLSSCGLGGGDPRETNVNEAAPNAITDAQATINAQSGAVSGTVKILRNQTTQDITVRIESLSFGEGVFDSALKVVATLKESSNPILDAPIKGSSGNQNYIPSVNGQQQWGEVKIQRGTGEVVGNALF